MITTVLAVLLVVLGGAVTASGVGFLLSERLWWRFERMDLGSTVQLPVLGVRVSREAGRDLMRASFRTHLRAAQVVMSIAGGTALIALGLLLLAKGS